LQTQQHASSSSSSELLAGHGSSVAWFVQLSDLHISKWVHHEILPDLAAFGQQVLTSVRPAAVLITGDLVDAKTRPEGSQQHEEEWQVRVCCFCSNHLLCVAVCWY
jgi:predicted MPP superfamily phosphohydrolase